MNIAELKSNIKYQFPDKDRCTTWSYCQNGCGNTARGGRECVKCLEGMLAEEIGSKAASEYVTLVREGRLTLTGGRLEYSGDF